MREDIIITKIFFNNIYSQKLPHSSRPHLVTQRHSASEYGGVLPNCSVSAENNGCVITGKCEVSLQQLSWQLKPKFLQMINECEFFKKCT